MITSAEKDETARLILMDMEKHEGFKIFAGKMREELDISTFDIQHIYKKYRGWDRSLPTHSIETGERLP